MDKFEIIITTLFGLESIVSREVKRLGYDNVTVQDGRVSFEGDWEAVCRANMWIRCGERVLIKTAEFTATTFEDLFQGTKAVEWERFIGRQDAFPVKGHTLKSQLASVRDCQAIIKKAIAARLSENYGIEWLPEEGAVYRIQFQIMKDSVTLMIDTSGDPLHKRGYRQMSNAAPLRETLAAAMADLSRWRFENLLCDPFCGSGTIPIEAAMMKLNIAPGLNRNFAFDAFPHVSGTLRAKVTDEAKSMRRNLPLEIYASDIDAECIKLTASNAEKAGVGEYIRVSELDARALSFDKSRGTIICNPPYGERLGEIRECEQLYREIGAQFKKLDNWSYFILTSNENFEKLFGRRADKKRKLYNGMLKCNLYQFFMQKESEK